MIRRPIRRCAARVARRPVLPAGQSTVETAILVALVAMVLLSGEPSVLTRILSALEEALQRFWTLLALP